MSVARKTPVGDTYSQIGRSEWLHGQAKIAISELVCAWGVARNGSE